MHVLHAPTHGGPPKAVLLNQEPWQRSVSADVCVKAETLHLLIAQRYADMSPAAKEAAGGPVLDGLEGTVKTLQWAQHPADLSGVDGGHTPVIETTRDVDDVYYFAFVRCKAPVLPQVLAALGHLFDSALQRSQLAALASPAA